MADKEMELSFDQALKDLEELVGKLESGSLSLEESMDAFEKAVKLSQLCNKKLTAAEQKIQKLVKLPDGSLSKEPVNRF
ncbi:MAG: exodeoxyribonuclease VII small subunit [Oligosphaeraceae bacterium]